MLENLTVKTFPVKTEDFTVKTEDFTVKTFAVTFTVKPSKPLNLILTILHNSVYTLHFPVKGI